MLTLKEETLLNLGYQPNDFALVESFPTALDDKVTELLLELASIDSRLMALTEDSNVTQLDTIRLDVTTAIKSLRSQGAYKLRYLGAITGYPVKHNRYSQTIKLSVRG